MILSRRLGRYKRQTAIGYTLASRLDSSWRRRTVTPRTEIVIDGFPRSGNTYATTAFLIAQRRSVSIAHHLHSPHQAARAQSLRIPCLILVRNPIDSVASLLVAQPWRSPKQALLEYGDFYERIEAWPVVVNFETVTTDIRGVIDQVNRRFDCTFLLPEGTDAGFDQQVFDTINVISSLRGTSDVATRISRPTAERQEILALKREMLMSLSPGHEESARERALDVYRHLLLSETGSQE